MHFLTDLYENAIAACPTRTDMVISSHMGNHQPISRVVPAASSHPLRRNPGARARILRAAPPVRKGPWLAAEQAGYLEALAKSDAIESAARAIGRSKACALAERARDPAFARAWDAILDPKVDRLEHLLLDRTIARLDGGADVAKLSDSALRQDAAVSMWFLEARKPERYGKARAVAPQSATEAVTSPADDAESRRVKIAEAISAAERRIAEAEVLMQSANIRPPAFSARRPG
jgi:hypothetical protein